MKLVERYLQAVRFWLPKQGKQDILEELAEDIRTDIESRQAALGRDLTDGEIAALLKERGRPILVANAYLPQRYLIGPVLFPIYAFVLKIVGLCYLVPFALVWIGLLWNSAHHASHPGSYWLAGAGAAWGSMWTAALSALGIATLIFAVLERVPDKAQLFEHWDPSKLPGLRDPNRIPRMASAFELAVYLVLLTLWAAKMAPLLLVDQPGLQLLVTPLWHTFFWGLLAFLVALTGLAAGNVIRPYWTISRATVRLAIDLAGSALFCWLMQANIFRAIHLAHMPPARAAEIANAVNMWMADLFPVVVLVNLVIVAIDIHRMVRVRGPRAGRAGNEPLSAGVKQSGG